MYGKVSKCKPNPKEKANPISRLFFWWTLKIFVKGARKDIGISDIYAPLRKDESERLGDRLEREWNKELEKLALLEYTVDKHGNKVPGKKANAPCLWKAILRAFWADYMMCGLCFSVQGLIIRTIQPLLQGCIIAYFDNQNDDHPMSTTDAYLYTIYLVLCLLGSIICLHQGNSIAGRSGMKVRVACSALMYRKILRLSKRAQNQAGTGRIINLLTNDVNRFDEVSPFLNYIWITPLQIILITIVMWQGAGIAALFGVSAILLMAIPSNAAFAFLSHRIRGAVAKLTDKRVQLMNELINAMQVIKMYAWERPFANLVSKTRAAEIKRIKYALCIRAGTLATVLYTDRAALYCSLVPYVLMGNKLTADMAYVLTTFFTILQLSTSLFFPTALILSAETLMSIKRIEEFLLLEETSRAGSSPVPAIEKVRNLTKSGKRKGTVIATRRIEKITNTMEKEKDELPPVSVNFHRVSANWISGQLPPTLCNLSIHIEGGQLCALIGAVGSGKSSILYLLLKELPLGAGDIKILQKPLEYRAQNTRGYVSDNTDLKISYASQVPWLFAGSVRDNILFGQPYDKEKYLAVTKACALKDDFKQLPYGDMSNVGENGSSLSGGQKARVNLARAVYRDADLYLLDDPLSAVDSRVAKHLFEECVQKYLHGKTRIIVTHQLQFIKCVDHIVLLDNGCVKTQGCYDELAEISKKFVQDHNKDVEEENENANEARSNLIEKSDSARRRASKISKQGTENNSVADDECARSEMEKEEMGRGRIPMRLYKDYFRRGVSCCGLLLLIFIVLMSQMTHSLVDYWVSYWTNLETVRSNMEEKHHDISEYNYMFNSTIFSSIFTLDSYGLLKTTDAIYVYTFILIACIVFILLRSFLFVLACANANRNLHNEMFSNILQSSMRFFHHNPSGRILNRFSKDIGILDEILPRCLLETVQLTLVLLSVLCMVTIANHWMIVGIAFLVFVFYFLYVYYLKTAQNVKRVEGIVRSPVFSHVTATLNGLTTIRNSGPEMEVLLRKEFDGLQDVHTGTWFLLINTACAFGFVLDVSVSIFIAFLCGTMIAFDTGKVLGGTIGLAISQSFVLIGTLQYGIRTATDMIAHMTAVERVMQYTNLANEGALTSNNPPPPDWPSAGRLTLKNVNLKYEDDEPPVLKDLNVTIEPGWKVGVVGRTGAGKSSLISVLFRLFGEGLEGEIKIDGRDTKTLGLHELRSRLSIIPQEPVLFCETLRYNLDPFRVYDDVVLWEVLREVELNDVMLDQTIQNSGVNFSVGQRQLVCLARAILRNNRILILDEATANIDTHTDSLIQERIRTKFLNCTVLTIAHRLNTIIDSDRIIVMDAGQIVEFGCPYQLLRNKPDGYFAQMVNKTGKAMAKNLWEQAEKACLKNNTERNLELSRENSSDGDTISAQDTL